VNGSALDLLLQAIPVAFIMFVVLNFGGLLTWVERKQSAIMQDRIGANRASIFGIRILGLLHPLADAVKMLTKEDFMPAHADRMLFKLAPFVSVFFALGAFASINYTANLSKTSVYKTKLDMFSNYLHNPQNISLYWTNILAVKVTRLVSMNLSVDMIYDNDIKSVKSDGTPGGPKPQIKEVMGIGLAYKFDNIKREPTKPTP